MIPSAAIPWRLVGACVAVGLLVWGALWLGRRVRISYQAEEQRDAAIANLDAYRASVEAAARVAAAQLAKDRAADAALTARIADLQFELETLRRALARIPATVEKPDANGVPRLAIHPDRWLCWAAQLGRHPADIAACQARAGDGEMQDPIRN